MSSGEGCRISSSTNPTYPDPPVNQRQRSLSLPRTKYERDFLGILAELKALDLSSLKLPPPLSTSESDETSPSAHNRSPTRENSPIGDQAPVGDQSPAGGQYPAPRKRVFYRKVDKAGNIIEISDSEKAANESGWETVSTLDDGASTSTDEEGRRPPQERRVDKPARASEHGPDSEKPSESEESLSYKPRPSNDTEARPAEHEDDPASRQESKDQNTQTQDSEHNSADPSAEDEATPEKPSQANNTEHAEREKKPTLDESAFEAENPSPTGPSDHGSDLSDAWSSEREYRTRKDEGTRQTNKALQGEEDQECRPSGPAPSTAPPRSPSPFNLSSDSTQGGHGLPPGEEVPENILSGSTAEDVQAYAHAHVDMRAEAQT
ncbi:hypothetical protein BJX61DRAFT_541001 [Aspergillus egyptiacus]|nr:hypothetical protein BJX61DRAFT_541001 [Aspergillus egyptiacus]